MIHCASIYISKINKYKTKYEALLEQKGGDIIPNKPPTQSWIYMPIILSPFANIGLEIPDDTKNYINETLSYVGYATFDDILFRLRQYYISKNISLNNYINLTNLRINNNNIKFDGHRHISGDQQVEILHEANIQVECEIIVQALINFRDNNKFFSYVSRDTVAHYNTIKIPETTKCIDDNGLKQERVGEKGMILWDCVGNENQRFKINEEQINNKSYYTIAKQNNDLCLNIEKPYEKESQIGYKKCKDATKFEFMKKDNNFLVRGRATEKCFDTKGNLENGSTITATKCDFKNKNQLFTF